MFDLVQHRKPKKLEAFVMIIIVFLMLGYPMIMIPNMIPHIPVLITIIFLLLYGTINKVKFSLLQESMIQSVSTSMGAVFLFFFIGILVSVLMMSGAIPTLMFLGLNVISTKIFYLSSFLITGIIFYFFLRNIEFSAQLILSVGFFFMIYIFLIATMIFLLPLISSLYFKNDEEYQYAKKIIKNYEKNKNNEVNLEKERKKEKLKKYANEIK